MVNLSKLAFLVKKEGLIFLFFCLAITISQFLLFRSYLDTGFAPDDVRAISHFKDLGGQPFSRFLKVWKDLGPHYANQNFYDGILFTIFGFNYSAYPLTGLIFKILSIITLYLLIQVVFKNRLLSFLTAFLYSVSYGAVNSLEMILKTQDYLVIAGINIFFICFYLYYHQNRSRLWLFLSGIILFLSFFIQPIRAFPALPFIFLLVLIIFLKNKSLSNLYKLTIDLVILFCPFIILLFIGRGSVEGVNLRNLSLTIQNVSRGNLQLLLTPFTTLGSLYIYGDDLKILSFSQWDDFGNYLSYLFGRPLVFFGSLTFALSIILSEKPRNFFLSVLGLNFILDVLLFFMIDTALNLPTEIKIHYDPFIFLPPAILGIYILALTVIVFREWLSANNRNSIINLFLLSILYSGILILFHWFFQDYVFIPVGIRGYSTVPALGVSTALASLFLLGYYKMKDKFKSLSFVIFLLLIPYANMSNNHIQDFLQHNLTTGMRASEQIDMREQFWSQVTNLKSPCNKLFYFYSDDYPNGIFYSYIFLDNFYAWYKLYNPVTHNDLCPLAFIVNDEDKLLSSYYSENGERGFLQKRTDEQFFSAKPSDIYKFRIENFYAFELKNRKIINIRPEILKKTNNILD